MLTIGAWNGCVREDGHLHAEKNYTFDAAAPIRACLYNQDPRHGEQSSNKEVAP